MTRGLNLRFPPNDRRAPALMPSDQPFSLQKRKPLPHGTRTDSIFPRQLPFWQQIMIGPQDSILNLATDILHQTIVNPLFSDLRAHPIDDMSDTYRYGTYDM